MKRTSRIPAQRTGCWYSTRLAGRALRIPETRCTSSILRLSSRCERNPARCRHTRSIYHTGRPRREEPKTRSKGPNRSPLCDGAASRRPGVGVPIRCAASKSVLASKQRRPTLTGPGRTKREAAACALFGLCRFVFICLAAGMAGLNCVRAFQPSDATSQERQQCSR